MTIFDTCVALFKFFILSTALTYYITQSFIFRIPRALINAVFGPVYLLYCPACVGTWIGLALYLAGFWPFGAGGSWTELAIAMCASCVVNRFMPFSDGVFQYETTPESSNDETEAGKNGED